MNHAYSPNKLIQGNFHYINSHNSSKLNILGNNDFNDYMEFFYYFPKKNIFDSEKKN